MSFIRFPPTTMLLTLHSPGRAGSATAFLVESFSMSTDGSFSGAIYVKPKRRRGYNGCKPGQPIRLTDAQLREWRSGR